MPSDNQNQKPNSPMPFSPQADLPPLPPAYQETPAPAGGPAPSQSLSQGSNHPNGSSAPPDLTAKVNAIITPKKKFGGGRIIATILGLVVLVGGVGAGILLTGQKQVSQKAAVPCPPDTCALDSDCGTNEVCFKPATGACPKCVAKPSGLNCTGGTTDCSGSCVDLNNDTSNCGACGRACSSGQICSSSVCTATPAPPAPPPSASCPDPNDNTCKSGGSNYRSWLPNHALCGTCTDGVNICGTWEGEPGVLQNPCCTGAGKCTVAGSKYPWTFGSYCLSTSTSNQDGCYPDAAKCASIQPCTAPSSSPTTPTTAPTAPSCVSVKAYNSSWTQLSNAELSSLKTGEKVNFCVAGNAPSGSFDQAQFKINTTLETPVSSHDRPSSTDFCQTYTISAGDIGNSVTVKAKIHHSSGIWVGEAI